MQVTSSQRTGLQLSRYQRLAKTRYAHRLSELFCKNTQENGDIFVLPFDVFEYILQFFFNPDDLRNFVVGITGEDACNHDLYLYSKWSCAYIHIVYAMVPSLRVPQVVSSLRRRRAYTDTERSPRVHTDAIVGAVQFPSAFPRSETGPYNGLLFCSIASLLFPIQKISHVLVAMAEECPDDYDMYTTTVLFATVFSNETYLLRFMSCVTFGNNTPRSIIDKIAVILRRGNFSNVVKRHQLTISAESLHVLDDFLLVLTRPLRNGNEEDHYDADRITHDYNEGLLKLAEDFPYIFSSDVSKRLDDARLAEEYFFAMYP